jgi:hypothetical protein
MSSNHIWNYHSHGLQPGHTYIPSTLAYAWLCVGRPLSPRTLACIPFSQTPEESLPWSLSYFFYLTSGALTPASTSCVPLAWGPSASLMCFWSGFSIPLSSLFYLEVVSWTKLGQFVSISSYHLRTTRSSWVTGLQSPKSWSGPVCWPLLLPVMPACLYLNFMCGWQHALLH